MNDVIRNRLEAMIAGFDLDDLLHPPAWHADAACRDHPELSWFPDRGEDLRPARAVCASCLVRSECLSAALEDAYTNGVWGGTSERERRRMRRAAPIAA